MNNKYTTDSYLYVLYLVRGNQSLLTTVDELCCCEKINEA